MKILVKRTFNNKLYCISHIYVDGVYICDVFLDMDNNFIRNASKEDILPN